MGKPECYIGPSTGPGRIPPSAAFDNLNLSRLHKRPRSTLPPITPSDSFCSGLQTNGTKNSKIETAS